MACGTKKPKTQNPTKSGNGTKRAAKYKVTGLQKPVSVSSSEFKSAKWDEITEGRNFTKADIPIIALLCQWYEVIERCMEDIAFDDGIHVAYANDIGDIKAFPQLATMKQASAEIRALNKQLGIDDEVRPQPKEEKRSPLIEIYSNRQARAKNIGAGSTRAG